MEQLEAQGMDLAMAPSNLDFSNATITDLAGPWLSSMCMALHASLGA